jgi:hypothetical protein
LAAAGTDRRPSCLLRFLPRGLQRARRAFSLVSARFQNSDCHVASASCVCLALCAIGNGSQCSFDFNHRTIRYSSMAAARSCLVAFLVIDRGPVIPCGVCDGLICFPPFRAKAKLRIIATRRVRITPPSGIQIPAECLCRFPLTRHRVFLLTADARCVGRVFCSTIAAEFPI